jgi:hypothetical protein
MDNGYLPGKMPILLADGSSKTLEEIVNNELDVAILTFNTKTNQQESSKILTFKKVFNDKTLLKVKVKSFIRDNKKTNFVICTNEQKIYANKSWIDAEKLSCNMLLQIETLAKKTQYGKITSKGKNVVASTMKNKNDSGVMVSGNRSKNKPVIQGGNGKSLPVPQKLLFDNLGEGWKLEHAVATGKARGSGYPYNYKLDIANTSRKLGIEIDGESHNNPERRAQDIKKTKLLESLGWTILRFKNLEVIKDLQNCLAKIRCPDGNDCPATAKLVSVEDASLNEYFLYNIEIENNNNYYANGILIQGYQELITLEI